VRHKLLNHAPNVDPAVLGMDPGSSLCAVGEEGAYAKYFRMVRVGLSREAVAHKVRADGLDEAVLALDPARPRELQFDAQQQLRAAQAGAAGAVVAAATAGAAVADGKRRKRLHWTAVDDDRVRRGDSGATMWSGAADAGAEFDLAELSQLFTAEGCGAPGGGGGGGSSVLTVDWS
jgi:hypothetical protein